MSGNVLATYEIATALPLEKAAAVIAGEQSSGTFVAVARESAELKARHAAVVRSVDELPLSGRPPLPGAVGDWADARRARIVVEFPVHNFGPSVPNLLAAVAGNLFELRELGELRLVDLEVPDVFGTTYAGPAFGVEGTKALAGKAGATGPLIGTIVKPSVGLGPEELAELVEELAMAGIDFIKDDELQGNPPGFPLADRVHVVMDVLKRAADRTGRMPMYAFNITDDISHLASNHDLVRAAGGTCVMVVINAVGFAGVQYLRERAELPIHGHRAMFGAFARSPQLGIAFRVFQKLARLVGVDHLHTNGIANKFYETDDEVGASITDVRTPLLGGYHVVPVLSSGQTPAIADRTYARVGDPSDLLVLAGGGIHAHPGGSGAGVTAMREAWDAAVTGEALTARAERSPELAASLAQFGDRP
ncbi:RuBisCO large subunit C-terminal-like domain-containing protein [Jiangella rhizosphaerae]|uniref:RuBisCO large subunit C-terminal-like domain-containing protein n=1 Tax=Jiangella rhizosphaerae TaxID=2293569 RepID=UPI0018F49DA7|nr:RuBisCO large subunit C-terminal-like domain-containing protein [Jiangella rhizosphaerae]